MFKQISNSQLMFHVALVVGSIGACGQAYLLYHELVDCLPYKEIGSGLYQNVANVGVWLAPLIAIFTGWVFGAKRFWLASIVPVILCPLLFAGVYKIISVMRGSSGVTDLDGNFGRTPAMIAQQFFSYSVSLAITGLVIGAICSFLLLLVLKPRKLA